MAPAPCPRRDEQGRVLGPARLPGARLRVRSGGMPWSREARQRRYARGACGDSPRSHRQPQHALVLPDLPGSRVVGQLPLRRRPGIPDAWPGGRPSRRGTVPPLPSARGQAPALWAMGSGCHRPHRRRPAFPRSVRVAPYRVLAAAAAHGAGGRPQQAVLPPGDPHRVRERRSPWPWSTGRGVYLRRRPRRCRRPRCRHR